MKDFVATFWLFFTLAFAFTHFKTHLFGIFFRLAHGVSRVSRDLSSIVMRIAEVREKSEGDSRIYIAGEDRPGSSQPHFTVFHCAMFASNSYI